MESEEAEVESEEAEVESEEAEVEQGFFFFALSQTFLILQQQQNEGYELP